MCAIRMGTSSRWFVVARNSCGDAQSGRRVSRIVVGCAAAGGQRKTGNCGWQRRRWRGPPHAAPVAQGRVKRNYRHAAARAAPPSNTIRETLRPDCASLWLLRAMKNRGGLEDGAVYAHTLHCPALGCVYFYGAACAAAYGAGHEFFERDLAGE